MKTFAQNCLIWYFRYSCQLSTITFSFQFWCAAWRCILTVVQKHKIFLIRTCNYHLLVWIGNLVLWLMYLKTFCYIGLFIQFLLIRIWWKYIKDIMPPKMKNWIVTSTNYIELSFVTNVSFSEQIGGLVSENEVFAPYSVVCPFGYI